MQQLPQLVLMDVNLPSHDGFYWCAQLRQLSQVPILYISSRGDDGDKIMAIAQGGDDYVEKPFRLEMLKAKVEAILRRTYQNLCPLGEKLYTYNYCIENPESFGETKEALDALVSDIRENCMVFILASGSILFMKLYNDAFEEKEHYLVMRKMGFDERQLQKSIARELSSAYVLPFAVMSIASYFSVMALEKVMHTELLAINILSVLVVFVIFLGCYLLSVALYEKNVGV